MVPRNSCKFLNFEISQPQILNSQILDTYDRVVLASRFEEDKEPAQQLDMLDVDG